MKIYNEIEIGRSPSELYAYVTQPWLWHEWHPNSRSATSKSERLVVGDEFDEVVAVQPFSPLPITLKRKTHYRVLQAKPHELFETKGQMKDGWLVIRYEFRQVAGGTLFCRTLTFEVTGLNRLLMPILGPQMERMSRVALANLKARVESEKVETHRS